jgi:hypothetical protein
MADAWGLGEYLPRSDLLIIGGKEYAAIQLLPWTYKTLDLVKREDPGSIQGVMQKYLKAGLLHRWGVLDFTLGNADRHANNLMIKNNDLQLIDHGSSMAGSGFDPAHDKNSFVPFYLRYAAPGKFSAMDAKTKLKYMPTLGREAELELRDWIRGLKPEDLDRILLRYGVDSAPAKDRLAKLKAYVDRGPADMAVNKIWVDT